MQGPTGDQGPKLGSRGPKMRQNHPETSFIPSHIAPKHIPKLFGGVNFHPQVPKKRLSPQTPPLWLLGTYRPNKTAKNSMGPPFATLKPVCGGPCGQPRAWMPPTMSQDTIQSLWDPTLGSPGHPGSGKIQLVKFSLFSKFALQNCQNPHRTIQCDPKTRLRGSLRAT